MAATAQLASSTLLSCRSNRWRRRSLLFPSTPVAPSPAAITSLCLGFSFSRGQPHRLTLIKARCWGNGAAAFTAKASATGEAPEPSQRWLLEPVGDGNSRHLGFRVPMPRAFEIDSDMVTVGRLPDKADMVIPVATVSGLHARLEKKEGTLLVTDLDSTNGTYVDERKLRPGAVVTVSPGSCITFGDTHLAMFRVSKIQDENLLQKPDDSEIKSETEVPQTETAS